MHARGGRWRVELVVGPNGQAGTGRRWRRARTAIALGALVAALGTTTACAASDPGLSAATIATTTGPTGTTAREVAATVVFRPVRAIVPPGVTAPPGAPGGTSATVAGDATDAHGTVYGLGPSTAVAIVAATAAPATNGPDLWQVDLRLAPGADGLDIFNELARACHEKSSACPTGQLAIMLDDEVLSAPYIEPDQATFTPFTADQISVAGEFDEAAATALAQRLAG